MVPRASIIPVNMGLPPYTEVPSRYRGRTWIELLFNKKQGVSDRKGCLERAHASACPGRQSRSLFIRTMTVGLGITPSLLTLRVPLSACSSARGLDALRAITAGGDSHPALRTFSHLHGWAAFLPQVALAMHLCRRIHRALWPISARFIRHRDNPPIIAHRTHFGDFQRRGFGHARQWHIQQRSCTGTEKLGGDKQLVFVHQA